MTRYATLLLLAAVITMAGCRRNDSVPPRAEKHDATKDTPVSTVSDFVDPALAADQAELAAEINRRKTVPAIGEALPPSTTTAPATTQPATAPTTDAAAATTQPTPLPDATPPPAPAPATPEPAAPGGATGGADPAGAAPAPKTGSGEFDLPGEASPPAQQ
ncbi:MAG: hypothetical protein ABFD92_13310 [Planctomycetaceae bacterium]|nr:hypothetical protein [Planctomycetaceae bacterium]